MKALITGFDPFGGESTNPSFEIVKLLPKEISGCEIVTKEIPTVFNKSLTILEETITEEQPDIVICIGQAGGEFNIRVERVGLNLNEARIPDNNGYQPINESIKEDGDLAYLSNLPAKAIVKTLKEHMIPANISYSAGTFVCNHILYGLMYLIYKQYPSIRGGFIHVPYLPEQIINKSNTAFMDISMMVKAIELCIIATINNDQDLDFISGTLH